MQEDNYMALMLTQKYFDKHELWNTPILVSCGGCGHMHERTYQKVKDKSESLNCDKCKIDFSEQVLKAFENKINSFEKKKEGVDPVVKNKVLVYLASRQRENATELIVQYILSVEKIYTIRSDKKIEIYIYKEGIYIPYGISYIKNHVRDLTDTAYTIPLSNEVIAKIETDTYIEASKFFITEDVDKIPVNNGILNLKTRELEKFSHQYFFFTKIPIDFIPGSTCENVKVHLQTVLKDGADVDIIQELFGWCLYRNLKPEKAFMFTGNGRNGKSKTIELLKRLLGADNCISMDIKRITEDGWARGFFLNKLANLGADIGNSTLKETNNFKNLTGHDAFSAPRKNKDDITFVNYAKMIFAANELPKTLDDSIGFWNRWELIDFPFTFLSENDNIQEYSKVDKNLIKKCDKNIIEKLTTKEELEGLLIWSVKGLDRLRNNSWCFSKCSSSKNVKNTWTRKSDSFAAFMMDCLVESVDNHVTKRDLSYNYNKYCKMHSIRPTSEKWVKSSLVKEYGVDERRIGDIRSWFGVEFNLQGIQGIQGISVSPIDCTREISTKTMDMVERVENLEEFIEKPNKIDAILQIISYLEENTGNQEIEAAEIVKRCPFFDTEIKGMLEKGIVFEPKPGFISKTE